MTNMDSYWISKAAEAEAKLEQVQRELEETIRHYQDLVDELERKIFEANCYAQTTGATNEHLQ